MEKLHGIVVPMVTPLNSDGSLDFKATEILVEHLISGGVHGIFVLGTTGEAQGLSAGQREKFVTFVGQKIAGRVPYMFYLVATAHIGVENAAVIYYNRAVF